MRNFNYKVDDIEGGYSLQLRTCYADIPRQLLHKKENTLIMTTPNEGSINFSPFH